MRVDCGEEAYLVANIELRVLTLANEYDLHLVDSLDGVLSKDVRNVVVGGTHLTHVLAHIEVEVLTSGVLNFERLKVVIVVLSLHGDGRVGLPLPWNILMDTLLVALGHKRTFLGTGLGYLLRLFKVDSNV